MIESLRGPADFDPIFASGHRAQHGAVCVRLSLGEGPGPIRLGLIVPKKKAPLASRRNAFKRVAREAARALALRMAGERSIDVVVSLVGSGKDAEVDAFKQMARADLAVALEQALQMALAGAARPARKPRP